MRKAFTLVETLMGVTVMALVLVAVGALVIQTMRVNQRNIHSLQAVYLAQEGVEAARFLRDSNWLQNYAWDHGFAEGTFSLKGTSCEGDPPCFLLSTSEADGELVLNGLSFSRSLEFALVEDHEGVLQVTAKVEWNERGSVRTEQVSTYLSDWK